MKVGLFINTQFPEGYDVAARVPEMVEQVRRARCRVQITGSHITGRLYPMQRVNHAGDAGFIAAHAQG